MKKIVLILMIMAETLTAYADSYAYLTFETTDGAKASFEVKSLTITLSGGTLIVGTQSFTFSNLNKMYFSDTDEGTTPTDIKELDALLLNSTEIFDLQGHKVAKAQMRKGIYIVKTKDRTYKIAVK